MNHNTSPISPSSPEQHAVPLLSPEEQAAYSVCEEYLDTLPGYQGAYSFGTPGGNDLDLRLCFENDRQIDQREISRSFIGTLRSLGVDKDVDLLFMSGSEFQSGIRDLEELGDVEDRLKDGFDPHEGQAAVGDTSMFSLYIFATMRPLHENQDNPAAGSPQEALDRLVLTREGAVGWSHFYTASFLHEYLQATDSPADNPAYVERLAKFSSRVIAGATLAQLDTQQLDAIKPQLIAAVQAAGPERSTDETISALLINHPDTAPLLDEESQALLRTAGMIRSGAATEVPATFATDAEARLFYESFQQGIERRGTQGEDADILTSYALGELIKDMGELQVYPPGGKLTVQGATEQSVMYIPLKTHDKQDNNGVTIEVRNDPADETIHYARTAGRVVGEGSIFGLPRSATVIANGNTEAFVIDADKLKDMLRDPGIQQQLTERTLTSREARRTDVLLRYFTREAGIYTRQTLPYTNLAKNQQTLENLGENPLAGYDMGQDFLRILEAFSTQEKSPDATFAPVVTLTSQEQPRPLFETGSMNEHMYVVAGGTVAIELQNGEHVTLQTGELFGESALLGLPATGSAALSENSTVIAVSAPWFTRFTQSRNPMQFEHMPPELRDKLPVQLQYHIAFKGYELVRRRLATQTLTH